MNSKPTHKIKITFIIVSLENAGAEIMLLRLLKHIDKELFEPSVISLRNKGPIGLKIEAQGVPVHCAHMSNNITFIFGFIRLVKVLKLIKPEIVNTWMYHADLLAGLAARMMKVPKIIWMIHCSNFIIHKNNWLSFLLMKTCSKLSTLIPNKILCVSQVAARQHYDYGYDKRKIFVIPAIVDTINFVKNKNAKKNIISELKLPNDTILVGLFGRYDPQKNHIGFIEAAKIVREKVPHVHFILSGRGIDYNNISLINILEKYKLKSVIHLLGFRDNIIDLYSSIDLYVSASSFGEAFPMVLCEAMSCEVPCVATDVGDSAFIIGDTGRIVQPNNANELANKIMELIKLDLKILNQYGSRARERIMTKFNAEDIVKRYEMFFKINYQAY